MKKREYAEAVERCIPQTPPVFHQAMSRTLEAIAAQAPAQERAAKVRPALSTRRALAFALAGPAAHRHRGGGRHPLEPL